MYEFNVDSFENDMDQYLHGKFKIVEDMYSALTDIQEYLKQLDKGWKQDNKEVMMETLTEMVYESKIYDI